MAFRLAAVLNALGISGRGGGFEDADAAIVGVDGVAEPVRPVNM